MGAAALPIAIGAGVGAMANKDNPMQGAMFGGAMGGIGGMAFNGMSAAGAGAAQAAPGMAGMTGGGMNNALYGALPGMGATAPGSQAAMLAAQTADFGIPGLMATGEAAAMPGSMAGNAFGLGNKMGNFSLGGTPESKQMMQAGQMISGSNKEQPPQQAPIAMMPPMQMGGGQSSGFGRPYQQGNQGFTQAMPSVLPSVGGRY